jgi:hypothetical protein
MKIIPLTYRSWKVIEENDDDIIENIVRVSEKGWICTCLVSSMYGEECKHIYTIKEYLVKKKEEEIK